MALAETAELAVKLSLGGNFNQQLAKARKGIQGFEKDSSRAFRAGQQIGTGIKRGAVLAAGGAALIASQVALGLDSLVKLESQTAQTNAVIKSTGGIAGVTAAKVAELSEKYESLNATIGDEVIREGQNLLLTFTNINNKAFEPALEAALNLNTALGKGPDGLTSTVRIVGKALNDPTKGLSALGRVGITFSKEQAKRIKGLQKEGKLYEAQAIILKELETRFGGSFLAGGNTTAGKVAKFGDAIEDLQRSLATALLPTVGNVADALSDLLQDKSVIKATEDLGREIGKLFSKDNIRAGAKALGDAFSLMKAAAPAISSALGTVGTVLKAAFSAFTSLPKEVQALLVGGVAVNKLTGGLVTNIAGGIFGALKAMTVQAGVVNVTGGVVNGGGGVPGAGGKVGGAGGLLGMLGLAIPAIGIGAAGAAASSEFNSKTGASIGESVSIFGAIRNLIEIVKLQNQPTKDTPKKITTLGVTFGRGSRDQISVTERVKQAQQETKRETTRGLAIVKGQTAQSGSQVVRQTSASGAAIVAAVRAIPAPMVSVNVSATTVTKKTTINNRYGPSGGSRNQDSNGSGTLGNGGR